MKAKSIDGFIASLPQEEQAAIEQEYQQMRAEQLTLQQLRKITGLSQEELADALEMKQGNLSRLENRDDVHVSTLRRYVEALGGKLHIIAALPDKPLVELSALSTKAEE